MKYSPGTNSWSDLGNSTALGLNWKISTIAITNGGDIMIGGGFTNSNGKRYVLSYNGVQWTPFGPAEFNTDINCILTSSLGEIYVAGGIQNNEGVKYVTEWNGAAWSKVGDQISSTDATIVSLCTDRDGILYAGGTFRENPNWFANHVQVFQYKPIVRDFFPKQATAGSTVIIEGRNFYPLTAVSLTFGANSPAEWNVLNDSTIVARVNGESSGDIRVSNRYGMGDPGRGFQSYLTSPDSLDMRFNVTGYFFHPSLPRAINMAKTLHKVNANTYETWVGDLQNNNLKFQFSVDAQNKLSNWRWISSNSNNDYVIYKQPASSFLASDNPGGFTFPGIQPGQNNYNNTLYNNRFDPAAFSFFMRYGYQSGATNVNQFQRQIYEKWEREPIIFSFTPNTINCNSGNTITVNGKYFTGITAVLVGNRAVQSYNVLSDTRLTIVLGANQSGFITLQKNEITANSTAPINSAATTEGRMYVANYTANTIMVYNTVTNTLVTTIPVKRGPRGITVSPDGTKLAVTNALADSITIINTQTNTIELEASIPGSPRGVSFDRSGQSLAIACVGSGTLTIYNMAGNSLRTVNLGSSPVGTVFTPDGKFIYCSNAGNGKVQVVETTNFSVCASIATGLEPFGLAMSPDGQRVYVANRNSNTLSVINTSTNTVIQNVNTGANPYGVCVSPDGARIYVSNSSGNSVTVITASTLAVSTISGVGNIPQGISVSRSGNQLFVANWNTPNITLINTTTNTVSGTLATAGNNINLGDFTADIVTTGCQPTITNVAYPGSCFGFFVVKGTGFYNITSVKIGNQNLPAGQYSLVSPTELKLRADETTEAGRITITTNAGTVISTDTIWLCPRITGFTPTAGCGNTPVTITGLNFDYVDSVKVGAKRMMDFSIINRSTISLNIGYGIVGPIGVYTKSGWFVTANIFESSSGRDPFLLLADQSCNLFTINTNSSYTTKRLPSPGNLIERTISEDGSLLVSIDYYKKLRLYDLVSGTDPIEIDLSSLLSLSGIIQSMALTRNKEFIYIAQSHPDASTRITEFSLNSMTITRTIDIADVFPSSIILSPDNQLLYIGGINGIVKSYHLTNNTIRHITGTTIFPEDLNKRIYSMAFKPDGSKLYFNAYQTNNTGIMSVNISNLATNFIAVPRISRLVAMSSDGNYVLSISDNLNTIRIIDATTETVAFSTTLPYNNITGMGILPNESNIVVTRRDAYPNYLKIDPFSGVILDTATIKNMSNIQGCFYNSSINQPILHPVRNVSKPCLPVITSITPKDICPNTPVQIKGLYFRSVHRITIGEVEVSSFTVVNDSLITCSTLTGKSGKLRIGNFAGETISTEVVRFGGVPTFTVNPSPFILCASQPREVITSIPDTTVVYQLSNGQSGKSVSVTAPGNYTLIATDTVGCTRQVSFTATNLSSCAGYLQVESTPYLKYFDDTITVKVQVKNGVNIFSAYAYLNYDAGLLRFVSADTGSFLGSNLIIQSPVVNSSTGEINFGATKTSGQPGSNGSGLLYSFKFVINNLPSQVPFDSLLPRSLPLLFRLSNLTIYNTSGVQPPSYNSISLFSDTTLLYYRIPVWPGDLNNDNQVNVMDVLPIGYFYGSTGPKRPNATLQWVEQPAISWGTDRSRLNSNAYKVFADGNADGKIDLADQTSIGFNLGNVHASSRILNEEGNRNSGPEPDRMLTNPPAISINIPDTVLLSSQLPQTQTVTVSLGSADNPLLNFYGVAFNIEFDPQAVNTNAITTNYTGSVMGQVGSDFIKVEDFSNIANGKLGIGLSRFNNAPVSASGNVLLRLNVPIPSGAPGGWLRIKTIPLQCNDQAGNILSVGGGTDSIRISSTVPCTNNYWNGSVSSAWENPQNWSCGKVPDVNTVVYIFSNKPNQPVINSMAVCKKLYNYQSSRITVNTGFSLRIAGN